MKKLIFIICAIFAYVNTTKAQYIISTSDLKGTKWQTPRQYDRQDKGDYEYTAETKIRHLKNGNTSEYPYYLSKNIPTVFDYTKVGKSTEGNYYVEFNPSLCVIYCYSIQYFSKTDGKMVLKPVDADISVTYIMIPSNKPRNQSANEPVLDPSIW